MKRSVYSLLVLLLLSGGTLFSQSLQKWKLADLQTAMKNAEGPTIINFWATYCKPCIQEIPYFQQIVKKYDSAGVKLILVSLDLAESYPKKIEAFASRQGYTAPIRFLDETNADLFCPAVDESWSGAIPASLFINPRTGYRKFFEKELTKAELEKEIRAMLQKN